MLKTFQLTSLLFEVIILQKSVRTIVLPNNILTSSHQNVMMLIRIINLFEKFSIRTIGANNVLKSSHFVTNVNRLKSWMDILMQMKVTK